MNAEDLKRRTKTFALAVVRLVQLLPQTPAARTMGYQLLRCGTSVGANYRASCRARSQADFVSKMGIVEEEADECIYWMELLVESGILTQESVTDLISEADQIVAIVVSSIRTAKGASK